METQVTETKLNSPAAPSFLGGLSFLGAVFDRSKPSRDVRQNNVPLDGLATGPLRSRDAATEFCAQARRRATSRSWRRIGGDGGFLRSAAMTATGIVGGALVFEGIQSMFGQHDAAIITGNQAALPGLGETFLSKGYRGTDASAAESISDHKYGISRVQSDGKSDDKVMSGGKGH